MREPAFLNQNREKWLEYERLLSQSGGRKVDPDRLAQLYVQLTDDLAYARTFYPKSQIVRYLNGLAARTHLAIYRSKREKRHRIITFWTEELPDILSRSQSHLLIAFTVFTFTFLLGLFAAFEGEAFIRAVLGDSYVNMTIDNIESGDPTGVYKQMEDQRFAMFLEIAVNNIRVSFFAFAAGLALSVGTVWVLFNNGLMLGAFFGMFHRYNVLEEALPVIYIHGALELSAIVIAGAAGFKLGNALLFPGTRTRRRSLQLQAKEGVKILVGLVPLFLLAAWLEAYVTRLSEWPLWAKFLIIGPSLAFVVGYYVWYPRYWARQQLAGKTGLTEHRPQGWTEPEAA